jgi:hypothetical protein
MGEIVPMAQHERENHSGITSAVCFELLLRGPCAYGFSPAAYRREAPIGGPLTQKELNLFFLSQVFL